MKKSSIIIPIVVITILVITFLVSSLTETSIPEQPKDPHQQALTETGKKLDSDNKFVTSSHSNNYLIILVLSLTTLFSISISFYLYKWRKVLLMNPEMIVPEKWAEVLITLGKSVKNSTVNVEKTLNSIISETNENSITVKNMTDTYMELQNALDSKDFELKRYKSGYDAYLYKKFIKRFIRIDQSLTDFMIDDKSENLEFIKRLFEDALDESGVSTFKPNLGDDYRTAFGIADNPKVEFTEDENLNFKIAEVIESGYKIDEAESGGGVVVPSKVKIYKFKKEV